MAGAPLEVEMVAPSWKVYERKLAQFPKKYEQAVRRATILATRLHQKSLKRVTPVRTGRLRRNWVIVANTPSAGIITNRTPYASYIEFGTSAHEIRPVKRQFLRFKPKGSSRYVFAKVVHHPGTPAFRMTVNAWRLDASRIRDIYRKEFEREVNSL